MKIALLRTAAVAIVFSLGVTALVDAQQPPGPGQALVEQPAGAPQDVRVTVVTPKGRQQQFATVERQRVPAGDGEMVTLLRPLPAEGERASRQEEDVQQEKPLTWQVAAGRRLWLIDPATKALRTCAVRNTSTVGVEEVRCLSLSPSRFHRTFRPSFAP